MTQSLEQIPVTRNGGEDSTLAEFGDKVRLVVNTASKCGLTPQFEGLEALQKEFYDQGFTVLAFPSNDFAGQEPLADDEIKDFCVSTYFTTFPLYAKIRVTGQDKHPLYDALTAAKPDYDLDDTGMRATLTKYGLTPADPPDLLWNFEKFLVGRDGEVIARFPPDTAPDDPALKAAIKAAL